jgi:hypothetical protein
VRQVFDLLSFTLLLNKILIEFKRMNAMKIYFSVRFLPAF